MRRLVAERRIPYLKIAGSKLRFLPDDLDAWLMEQRIQAVP
jgi:excisionase family DNA binding protein